MFSRPYDWEHFAPYVQVRGKRSTAFPVRLCASLSPGLSLTRLSPPSIPPHMKATVDLWEQLEVYDAKKRPQCLANLRKLNTVVKEARTELVKECK